MWRRLNHVEKITDAVQWLQNSFWYDFLHWNFIIYSIWFFYFLLLLCLVFRIFCSFKLSLHGSNNISKMLVLLIMDIKSFGCILMQALSTFETLSSHADDAGNAYTLFHSWCNSMFICFLIIVLRVCDLTNASNKPFFCLQITFSLSHSLFSYELSSNLEFQSTTLAVNIFWN